VKHLNEAGRIWHTFVPKQGQADTVQGELLRAVEKLRDGAIRNGNLNWDEGFETLLRYIEEHLLDPQVYDGALIVETASILKRLKDYKNPCTDDEPYDHLGDRVVEYFRHYGSLPHAHDPALRR
jgi:hypothetical protein